MAQLAGITIEDLMDKAMLDLYRLKFAASACGRYCQRFREFGDYCAKNGITRYEETTGRNYFAAKFGIDIADIDQKLTKEQVDVRCALRFLDELYHFGYARRNCFHDYRMPQVYEELLAAYLKSCVQGHNSEGTLYTKKKKLRDFFAFLEGRRIKLSDLTSADISEFVVTLAGLQRSTIKVSVSVLRCFLRYLKDEGILSADLSPDVPWPKIYVEESIPEVWTTEELRVLLSSIDRTGGVGKRDYAMILLATMLGMRTGDICALKFENFDWRRKLITYTQQKTGKVNTLPILPEVGDAVIDYIKNGRLESDSKNVFVRHVHPYGEFLSSSALSLSLKAYMRRTGLTIKNRKAVHSLRHTLASCLLSNKTSLLVIADALGHDNPATTLGYTKVDIPPLRDCALSYSGKVVAE